MLAIKPMLLLETSQKQYETTPLSFKIGCGCGFMFFMPGHPDCRAGRSHLGTHNHNTMPSLW